VTPLGRRDRGTLRAAIPRWLFALAILGAVALGLSGLTRAPAPAGSSLPADDEILAYHIEEGRDLVIKVPIEIDAVEATTWAAVVLASYGLGRASWADQARGRRRQRRKARTAEGG